MQTMILKKEVQIPIINKSTKNTLFLINKTDLCNRFHEE